MNESSGDGSSFPLTPLEGTYIIGLNNAVFSLLAILLIISFGRRTLLTAGSFFMALSTFMCGLCILYEWNMAAFISVNVFIMCYHFSTGAVNWLYIPEVTVDVASGLCIGVAFANGTLISLTFEFMINSPLKVYGSIWWFSIMSAIAFVFCLVFLKETRGLTDIQKKTLYTPKNFVE